MDTAAPYLETRLKQVLFYLPFINFFKRGHWFWVQGRLGDKLYVHTFNLSLSLSLEGGIVHNIRIPPNTGIQGLIHKTICYYVELIPQNKTSLHLPFASSSLPPSPSLLPWTNLNILHLNLIMNKLERTARISTQYHFSPFNFFFSFQKCFVIVATGFTLMGIVYGFWYKNFGPGKKMTEKYYFN